MDLVTNITHYSQIPEIKIKENCKVLVCGGREYNNKEEMFAILDEIHNTFVISKIVEGDAKGADRMSHEWAVDNSVDTGIYPAQWRVRDEETGKIVTDRGAGPKRNQKMLDLEGPDLVVAFKGGNGTKDMVRRSSKQGYDVLTINWEAAQKPNNQIEFIL